MKPLPGIPKDWVEPLQYNRSPQSQPEGSEAEEQPDSRRHALTVENLIIGLEIQVALLRTRSVLNVERWDTLLESAEVVMEDKLHPQTGEAEETTDPEEHAPTVAIADVEQTTSTLDW